MPKRLAPNRLLSSCASIASVVVCMRLAAPEAGAQTVFTPAVTQPPMPTVITPGMTGNVATARRDRNGHFVFDAEVNGTSLPMMFDTGASFIVLRAEDAGKAGIDSDALTYSTTVNTGNGRTTAAPVTIETLTVGGITRHNVRALVSRPGDLGVNLLGQSFMAMIGGYRLVGQDLVLQGEP